MSKSFNVYGLGNAIMDLQLRVSDEDLLKLGLEKAAMKLVDPIEQKKIIDYFSGAEINLASGGSAANTVIALTQLGGRAAYCCLVGDDSYGKFYQDEMRRLGVELHTEPLSKGTLDKAITGTCVILITPDAERTMNTHLGASAELSEEHVSEELIKRAEWLYIEGYLFSSDKGRAVIKRGIELAKRHNTKVAVTFSDGFIVDVFGDALRAAVSQADLVFANLNEGRRFSRKEDENEVLKFLKTEVKMVALTLSERGALISANGVDTRLSPFPVRAVDDTGAGDMFAGAFLFGITHGMRPEEAGRLACFLASKVVSQLGPRLSCDLKELLQRKEFLPAEI